MDSPFRHTSRLKFVNFRLRRAVRRHIFGNVRFCQNESALELLNFIFENTTLKGSFWQHNRNFEFSLLAPDSRYLQRAALKFCLEVVECVGLRTEINDQKAFTAVVVIPQYKRSRTVTGHLSQKPQPPEGPVTTMSGWQTSGKTSRARRPCV